MSTLSTYTFNIGTQSEILGRTFRPTLACDLIGHTLGYGGIVYEEHLSEGGDWEPETIIVFRVHRLCEHEAKSVALTLCKRLGQEAIAYHDGSEGGLVFHPEYSGERYEFNSEYFIPITQH